MIIVFLNHCFIFQGVAFPAMNSILASWVLPEERSKFSGFIYAGEYDILIICMFFFINWSGWHSG